MSLLVQPIQIHFEITQPWERPFYTGSLWRGLFGHSLRKVSCMTAADACEGCPLTSHCSYYQVFEPKGEVFAQKNTAAPPPYVINPPAPQKPARIKPGGVFTLSMNLLGSQAIEQLPEIFAAWKMACKLPVAGSCTPFALQAIEWFDLQGQSLGTALTPHELTKAKGFEPEWFGKGTTHLALKLLTPLRLRVSQQYLQPSSLSAVALMKALLRRTYLLEAAYGETSSLPEQWQGALGTIQMQQVLRWVDWQRWSNRQKQHMQLGGLVGEICLKGDLQPFLPALSLLPWVNLGKNCSFGLGQISVTKD